MFYVSVVKLDLDRTDTLPIDTRYYCIGDVHGCSDLLKAMITCIDHHVVRYPVSRAIEIHLGDMVDRGPDSRGVLDMLMASPPRRERILIRGNHEQRVLGLLENPQACEQWLYEGGYETLFSYGVPHELLRTPLDGEAAIASLRRSMGDHVAMLESTKLFHEAGDFLFVHAGVDPYRSLDEQSPGDFLNIREPFLSFPSPWERMVIHGHTPDYGVTRGPHRVGLDTGAYATGRLTCLVMERHKAMTVTISRRV